jgi:DNA (cytosine-5)-methyltransferase 1
MRGCQSFSISGKKQGIGDPNGKLFYEIIRIARYHRPSLLLLENVKNILTVNDGKVICMIERELAEIGYRTYRELLNASLFGAPQARERVYFICLRKESEERFCYTKPKPSYKQVFLETS